MRIFVFFFSRNERVQLIKISTKGSGFISFGMFNVIWLYIRETRLMLNER